MTFTGPVAPKAVALALETAAVTLDLHEYQVREAVAYALLTFGGTAGQG